MQSKKFMKDVLMIGFTQGLINLSGFFLLPIITKSIGSYYYGIWAQITITISLLTPIAVLGLSMGFVRFLSGEKDTRKIKNIFYSILVIVFVSGMAVSLLLFLLSNYLAVSFFNDLNSAYFIKLSSFLILLSALNQISIYYFRVFQKMGTFAFLSIFRSIGHMLLTILLIHLGFGLIGIIMSLLTIESILMFFSISLVISEIGITIPNFKGVKEILNYSLPLTPNNIIRWVTDSSDRYMINYLIGLSFVGVYSASYTIGNLIQFLVFPIQFILFPELSKLYNQKKHEEVKKYISYSLKYFLLIAIPVFFGLSILAKPLLSILTTEEFVAGSTVIPFVALTGILSGVFQILINITHLVKKTQFNLFIHIFAASANIIFNLLLIPIMGITGAAFATLISYFIMIILCAHVSFKHIKPDISWFFIFKSISAAFLMALTISFFSPNNLAELISLVILGAVVYTVLILGMKCFNENEIKLFMKLILKLRIKIRGQN